MEDSEISPTLKSTMSKSVRGTSPKKIVTPIKFTTKPVDVPKRTCSIKKNISPVKIDVTLINSSAKHGNFQDMIEKESLVDKLTSLKYEIVSCINLIDDKQTDIVKAISSYGQTHYIIIDEPNRYNNCNKITMNKTDSKFVPNSFLNGAFICAGNGVCGVVFECGPDNLCLLSRMNNNIEPSENTYTFDGLTISESNTSFIMSYPVVRLSEIEYDNNLVLEQIDKATRMLRNNAFKSLQDDFSYLENAIDVMYQEFTKYKTNIELSTPKITSTLDLLYQWNLKYLESPPLCEKDREKFKQVQFNLKRRNQNAELLLHSMRLMINLNGKINGLAEEMKSVNKLIGEEFSNLENINVE